MYRVQEGGRINLNIDLSEPVEISADTYWVGRREDVSFERNIYLRVFKGGGKEVNMVMDPGPPSDFEALSLKLSKIINDPKYVHIAFINHQDPDVAYNATYLQKMNPKLITIATQATWRLIRYYGLKDENFRAVEDFSNHRVMLTTGHKLIFVPTPFVHFRGACMAYDPETQILFSGDFFGGLTETRDLYATKDSWNGIKAFHQVYVPSREAITLALSAIKKLTPSVLVIAPQHGGIIQGELVQDFLNRMSELEVGLDLIKKLKFNVEYRDALNQVIKRAEEKVPKDKIGMALKAVIMDKTFPDLASIKDNRVTDITADPIIVFERIIKALMKNNDPLINSLIRANVTKELLDRNLPLIELDKSAPSESPEFFEV
jgi:flavorubredoxin